jgi:hypothetical protein
MEVERMRDRMEEEGKKRMRVKEEEEIWGKKRIHR